MITTEIRKRLKQYYYGVVPRNAIFAGVKVRALADKVGTSKKFLKVKGTIALAHKHPTLTMADKIPAKRVIPFGWKEV